MCYFMYDIHDVYCRYDLFLQYDKQVLFWRERTEFIFTSLMAILLIYLFNPIKNKMFMINNETKLLLYLFGIVLIITADWKTFFKESNIFKKIQFVV